MKSTMSEEELAAWTAQMTNPKPVDRRKMPKPGEAFRIKPERTVHPPAPKSSCQHRFRIEEPNGPLSDGKCSRCGECRRFKNYDDADFETRQRAWKELA